MSPLACPHVAARPCPVDTTSSPTIDDDSRIGGSIRWIGFLEKESSFITFYGCSLIKSYVHTGFCEMGHLACQPPGGSRSFCEMGCRSLLLLWAFAATSWAGVCPGGQDHRLFATRRRDVTFDSHFMGVGYVCPDYTADLDTASAMKCAKDCGDKPTCMAVSYDHIHGTCRLCTSQYQISTTAWTTYSAGPCITCAAGATSSSSSTCIPLSCYVSLTLTRKMMNRV